MFNVHCTVHFTIYTARLSKLVYLRALISARRYNKCTLYSSVHCTLHRAPYYKRAYISAMICVVYTVKYTTVYTGQSALISGGYFGSNLLVVYTVQYY